MMAKRIDYSEVKGHLEGDFEVKELRKTRDIIRKSIEIIVKGAEENLARRMAGIVVDSGL